MARKVDRAIAWFFAGIFILSSSILTIAIIVEAVQNNKKPDTEVDSTQDSSKQEAKVDQTPLQGTKLANFTPLTTPVSKLQTTDLKVGDGEVVKAGATITFHYTGALAADGTIFQSSHDTGQAATFGLKDLIKGWQEGIPGMKAGGQRRLVIPYAQAYGEAGRPEGGIPAKADLVFDIEVTDVKNP